MKHIAFYLGIVAALVASCSIQEEIKDTSQQNDKLFYASFEQPSEGTRVYANEDLLLRWTADDCVSIFEKNTYNQQFRFTGETGDNAGGFKKVGGDDYYTGNGITHIVSVYPYLESTKISESEVITVTLPAEQHYAENTFGLGANTMVSVSSDNFLQYKNVCGYLVIKLYGEGVSVSSIRLKGNNGEKLAGKATVTMPLDGTPSVTMAEDATDQITLVFDTPVTLGATAEESKDFWLVIPPVTFSKGFTVTVSGKGGVFEKSTEKTVTIERNKLSKMAPIEVELTPTQPRNVIYYTSSDGVVVTPNNPDVFGASILSNEYVDGLGVITFDGDVTSIGKAAFYQCSSLTDITLPETVNTVGDYAFCECGSLTSITLPETVNIVGDYAFYQCSNLTDITLPKSLTTIGHATFAECVSLTNITFPDCLTSIADWAFLKCTSLSSINLPESVTTIGYASFAECTSIRNIIIPQSVTTLEATFYGCYRLAHVTLPESLTTIGYVAFGECTNLHDVTIPKSVTTIGEGAFQGSYMTSITIPESVTSIGEMAFYGCIYLSNITVLPKIPPTGGKDMFEIPDNGTIYVPDESFSDYLSAQYWSDYAYYIVPIW